jgi:hypothetical protein
MDPAQHFYCPVEHPTYFTPIVSQSDYYTSVLADEAAKKLIAQQIEYYFSVDNLLKDFFLRRQMDSDGWIPVELLASFRRVRIHTGAVNVQLIVDSMTNSKVVEISADQKHMRTRHEPLKWSLQGVEPTTFSTLNASVPEFIPGQLFKVAASPSQTSDVTGAAMEPTESNSGSVSVATVEQSPSSIHIASRESGDQLIVSSIPLDKMKPDNNNEIESISVSSVVTPCTVESPIASTSGQQSSLPPCPPCTILDAGDTNISSLSHCPPSDTQEASSLPPCPASETTETSTVDSHEPCKPVVSAGKQSVDDDDDGRYVPDSIKTTDDDGGNSKEDKVKSADDDGRNSTVDKTKTMENDVDMD